MSTPIVRPYSRRLRDWWYAPVLIVAGILLPGWFAPPAHANPVTDAVAVYGLSVCERLDNVPGADGVTNVLVALIRDGYTPGQAADIVAKSVLAFCGYHAVDVQAFVDKYAPNTQGQRA